MNMVELFLSGKVFPPLFLLSGIVLIFFGRSKKYYDQVATNHGAEHAAKTIKMLRLAGPALIVGSALMVVIGYLRQ